MKFLCKLIHFQLKQFKLVNLLLLRLDLLWKITNQDSNLTFNNNSILFLVITILLCLTMGTLLAKTFLFKIFGRPTRCVLLLERQLPIYVKLDFFWFDSCEKIDIKSFRHLT